MITLDYYGEILELPADLEWTDEFGWPAVEQRTTYTAAGALLLEAARKLAGRTIELAGSEQRAWMTREHVALMRLWASNEGAAGALMTLTIRGQAFEVVFDHARGAIEARAVQPWGDLTNDDFCVVTLRFLTVVST